MSEVREEYTHETYPSFGKKYNGERAIISLTSWRARINTVSKTLFSLLKQCPGFHIVLVLSEEEFPKMMDELPENLKLFVDNKHIEVLWVYKNYKSFKKILFTMDKYRDVPIISADDDCIYLKNYAQMLYNNWSKNKDKNTIYAIWTTNKKHITICSGGEGVLYPPNCFNNAIKTLSNFIISTNHDDLFFAVLSKFYNLEIKQINWNIKRKERWIEQETSKHGLGYTHSYNDNCFETVFYEIKKLLNM